MYSSQYTPKAAIPPHLHLTPRFARTKSYSTCVQPNSQRTILSFTRGQLPSSMSEGNTAQLKRLMIKVRQNTQYAMQLPASDRRPCIPTRLRAVEVLGLPEPLQEDPWIYAQVKSLRTRLRERATGALSVPAPVISIASCTVVHIVAQFFRRRPALKLRAQSFGLHG